MNNDVRGGAGTITGGSATFTAGSGSPVNLTIDHPAASSKLYAVPVLGLVIKQVMLIPHFIALTVVGAVAALMSIYAALAVLFTGTYPQPAYNWLTGTVGWGARIYAYFLGLTDQYPPFSLSVDTNYPVQFSVAFPDSPKRFFAIPLIGLLAREIMLIPSLIVAYALSAVVSIIFAIAWIPVLFTGRYPAGLFSFCVGTLRWDLRNFCYLYGLTEQYPPFQLGA